MWTKIPCIECHVASRFRVISSQPSSRNFARNRSLDSMIYSKRLRKSRTSMRTPATQEGTPGGIISPQFTVGSEDGGGPGIAKGSNQPESLIITPRNPTDYEIMEVLEAIKSGKSARKFKPTPVPEQKVQAIFNAARLAPSADNLQPWRFIVVSDEDLKKQVAAACTNAKRVSDAPLVIVACARLDEAVATVGGYMNSYPVDVGRALSHLSLAATSEGLEPPGSSPSTRRRCGPRCASPRTPRWWGCLPLGSRKDSNPPRGASISRRSSRTTDTSRLEERPRGSEHRWPSVPSLPAAQRTAANAERTLRTSATGAPPATARSRGSSRRSGARSVPRSCSATRRSATIAGARCRGARGTPLKRCTSRSSSIPTETAAGGSPSRRPLPPAVRSRGVARRTPRCSVSPSPSSGFS